MILRRALPSEYAEVGELTVAAYAADGFLASDDDYADELRAAAHRAAEAELIVAAAEQHTGHTSATRLLGTVTFCLSGSHYAEISRAGEAEFRMLAVAPEARSRGVGHDLVRWCVDRAREQGCTGLALSSLDRMQTAHRLYERMGFARTPDRDWQPHPALTLVAYVLPMAA